MGEQEFTELMQRNYGTLIKIIDKHCRKYSKSDLLQEIYLELWRSRLNFKGDSSLKTWVYAVARNTCISHVRKQVQRIPTVPLHFLDDDELPASVYDTDITKQRNDAMCYNCMLDATSEPYKTLLNKYAHGESYKQLEQYSGIPLSTIRVTIHRIKKQLYKKFKDIYLN